MGSISGTVLNYQRDPYVHLDGSLVSLLLTVCHIIIHPETQNSRPKSLECFLERILPSLSEGQIQEGSFQWEGVHVRGIYGVYRGVVELYKEYIRLR